MINGNIFRDAIISGANNICAQKQALNDLNIFPVPDGDTGTNMSMTISAAAKELKSIVDAPISEVASKTASYMLRGARGNSGVILSIIFRGFAKGLKDKEKANGEDLVDALGIGVDEAYKAVTKPTEGTILTVARMAYEAGMNIITETGNAKIVWTEVVRAAEEALELTPKYLPVLKKAGVVDAGGKGLLVIFQGMLSVIADDEIIEFNDEQTEQVSADTFESAAAQFDEVINFTYCTEFIVGRDAQCLLEPQALKEYLMSIGDCVVVVDDEEIIKVHVHTDNPGNALQKGLKYGQLLTVKVENMKEQHKNAGNSDTTAKKLEKVEPTEEIGFISVAAGEGLSELFMDMGCNHIVSGGQSMNPSTDDIYDAIMATPAKVVVVLPNNKNIVMAAKQAVDMVEDREVYVIESKTISQGLTALINYDEDSTVEENIETMSESIKNVITGQITFAARDSEFGGKKIKEGEIIGLKDGKLCVCEKSSQKALLKLAKEVIKKGASFVTLIYGEDITEEEANEAYELLVDKYGSNLDISLIKGDQPIYYYIVGVEY